MLVSNSPPWRSLTDTLCNYSSIFFIFHLYYFISRNIVFCHPLFGP